MPTTLPCRRAAFALVPALILVALAAACAFSLAAQSLRQSRADETLTALHAARAAALAGTRIALGELQLLTGTDACATAPISTSPETATLAGAWNRTRQARGLPEYTPLISNRGIFSNAKTCKIRDRTRMPLPAEIPWETVGENARFAYFIIDESLRASIAKRERDAFLNAHKDNAYALQRIRQQTSRRARLEDFFENESPDAPDFRKKIDAASCARIFLAAHAENFNAKTQVRAQNALTFDARAVPADWKNRQLKTDLSDERNFAELAELVPVSVLRPTFSEKEIPHSGIPVATRPPLPEAQLGHFSHAFPLVSELKLHFGFFNPRSDGQHRARFHVTARFWNPYAFPLLAHGDGRLGLFDVKNLPPIRIENQNTGGEIVFTPSDFPVGRFGLVRQTPSDKTCNAYCRIFDASDQGFAGNAAGLHAGEVFLARFPDPVGQPNGLARNLGGKSWKYQKKLSHIDKPPPGAKPDAWFHPAHVIRIESLPSFFPASFLVRGDAGTLRQQSAPEDYSEPVIEFKNVPFPAFAFEFSGSEYNREKAGDYDISRADLVWKIRLKTEDAKAMRELLEIVEPRRGIFDFSIPAVRNAFEVSTLTGAAARAEAEIGGDAETPERNPSPLRDRFPNAHRCETENAFSCIRIFDTPHIPVLSVGALRHLAFEKFAPLNGFGQPEKTDSARKPPNAIFDRAYFSETGADASVFSPADALISGAFNVNSENADAWAIVLSHNVPAWRRVKISAGEVAFSAPPENLARAFFMLPFSAQFQTTGSSQKFFSDEEISALPRNLRKNILFGQGLREVDAGSLKKFAEKITEQLKARRKRGDAPFASLEEFFNSGVLAEAIRESEINRVAGTEIPDWLPAAISQSALAESLAPTAAPRGDTFTILCRAEIFHPISGKILGTSCAEMRVQRQIDFFDDSQSAGTPFQKQNAVNRALGRRYKITAFRWLPHDEL